MGKGGAGGLRSGCCLDSFIHSFNKSIQQLFDPYPERVGCRRRDYSSEHGNSNDKQFSGMVEGLDPQLWTQLV